MLDLNTAMPCNKKRWHHQSVGSGTTFPYKNEHLAQDWVKIPHLSFQMSILGQYLWKWNECHILWMGEHPLNEILLEKKKNVPSLLHGALVDPLFELSRFSKFSVVEELVSCPFNNKHQHKTLCVPNEVWNMDTVPVSSDAAFQHPFLGKRYTRYRSRRKD